MNRRQFLLGAAATPVAFALPLSSSRQYVVRTGLPTVVWRKIHDGIPVGAKPSEESWEDFMKRYET